MISRTRRWVLWLTGAVLVAVAAVLGGTFVYIHFISGPAPAQLSLKTPATSSAPSTATGSTAAAVTVQDITLLQQGRQAFGSPGHSGTNWSGVS